MSRYRIQIPATQEIKDAFMRLFQVDVDENNLYAAWGFDAPTGGYYIQIWAIDPDGEDCYLEDGLMGSNKNRILEKLEKYNILDHIRKHYEEDFTMLCLDLPF